MKYKIIRFAFSTWAKAIGIYLLLTIFTIGVPVIYWISSVYAVVAGLPGLLIFALFLLGLRRYRPADRQRLITISLIAALFISFLCTWLAAYHFSHGRDVWESYINYCLFPIIGMGSAITAIAISKNKLATLYFHSTDELDLSQLFSPVSN